MGFVETHRWEPGARGFGDIYIKAQSPLPSPLVSWRFGKPPVLQQENVGCGLTRHRRDPRGLGQVGSNIFSVT